jgi:3-hydroxyisobutyrate dehydrogenase-like beta-hydroxyacid dehydrogenase
MSIGFIGLGQMGGRMVKNLAKNGRKVVAFDLSEASLDAARGNGASTAASVAEVHLLSRILGCPLMAQLMLVGSFCFLL